ncbi:hypothetical protein MRB53_007869 [Persea americana]|uniref:Uncharacterized protein n=1 Tax=Persea americana TaxID=3435 RepID=A0ACC2MK40_PERAE|nr:hypothetical protein MRB53_007869 [Persea americana]
MILMVSSNFFVILKHLICFCSVQTKQIGLSHTLPMDWQGQKLAELLMQIILGVFAVAAFVAGYSMGSFQTMLLIYAGGVGVTTLFIVPNWPFFNRHPLNWLDPVEVERHPKPQALTSKKKSSSKHK